MNRDTILTGLVIAALILGLGVAGIYKVTEYRREVATVALQTKAETISERYYSQSVPWKPSADGSRDVKQRNGAGLVDTIAAFETLDTKMDALTSSEAWERFSEYLIRAGSGEQIEADKRWIGEFLDANRELILELRKLAETCDSFQGLASPQFIRFIHYARLLKESATLAAEQGDYGEMFQDLKTAFLLAIILDGEPAILSQLVSRSLPLMMRDCIARHVRMENLSPDMAAQLISLAAHAGNRERFADAFILAGAEGMDFFEAVRTGNTDYPTPWFDDASWGDSLFFRLYGTVGRPLLDMDASLYADITNQASEAMRLPFHEAKPLLEGIEHRLSRIHPITSIMIPNFVSYADRQACVEAEMGLLQTGLAVEQYHAQHGQYPQTLDQIAPALGGVLPLDPYTGRAFAYEPNPNSFTLYSARGNLLSQDDYPYPTDAQGNIVWRYTRE